MTIIATPKATNANSFATVAEADAYHDARLNNSEWTGATTENKEKALKQATRILNNMAWVGAPTTTDQALKFPRYSLYNSDGVYIDSDTIPQLMIDAVSELAWTLLKGDTQVEHAARGIKSVSAGPVNVSFDKEDRANTVPTTVIEMIEIWLESSPGSVRLARG